MDKLGLVSSYFSRFYDKPHDGHAVATVMFRKPLPETQCNFYIDSNENSKDAARFLPEKSDDNLIALRFECSAESREEYFPVTYRQS